MYGIRHNGQWVRSAELQRELSQLDQSQHPEVMRHICAIEHLEARGAQYCNQDFDVLGAACSYLNRKTDAHCKTPGCRSAATFFPHTPNCGFCDQHGAQIIRRTVESIDNGTHPLCSR